MGRLDDFGSTATALIGELDRIAEEELDNYDVRAAFDIWVAREFEGVGDDSVVFTRCGADLSFFIAEPMALTLYSCEIDEGLGAGSELPTWGPEVVERFFAGVDAVVHGSLDDGANSELRRASKSLAGETPGGAACTCVTSALVVMGELSLSARQQFEALRRERGFSVGLVTWAGVRERLSSPGMPPAKSFHIDLRVHDMRTDMLKQRDWLVGLVYAKDIVGAMERFGVQLFDLNVRNELRKSRVNKEILGTISRHSGRCNFHHLNNGILIACNAYSIKGEDRVRVHSPQIINGCQTVSSLHRAYSQLEESERADFDEHVRVQVKLLQHPDPDLLDQIVISTNSQNPMKPRNLLSNTFEQKAIQQDFRSLGKPWFYIRKDGEFEALCESPRAKWFRRSHYQVAGGGSAACRTIDNVALAKDWYSWIGGAPTVLRGGNDFFGDEALYRRTFRLRPTPKHWRYFSSGGFKGIDNDLFAPGPPSAAEYLLARTIATYIRGRGVSPYRNRREALMRGVREGALSGNGEIGHVTSSSPEQAAFLAADDRYRLNNYLNNMEDVLVELAAYAAITAYAGEGESMADQILACEDVAEWSSSGFAAPASEIAARYSSGLLEGVAQAVRSAAMAFCRDHYDEISAAPRAKMFFGRRENILEMRTYLTPLLFTSDVAIDLSPGSGASLDGASATPHVK